MSDGDIADGIAFELAALGAAGAQPLQPALLHPQLTAVTNDSASAPTAGVRRRRLSSPESGMGPLETVADDNDDGSEGEDGSDDDDKPRRGKKGARTKKPHLMGRFSGRLVTKEDERKVADECKMLGPMLGGVGKRGDKSRLTLAKIVRGIASGDVRRHCEQREQQIKALTQRLQELETGGNSSSMLQLSTQREAMMQVQAADLQKEVAALKKELHSKAARVAQLEQELALHKQQSGPTPQSSMGGRPSQKQQKYDHGTPQLQLPIPMPAVSQQAQQHQQQPQQQLQQQQMQVQHQHQQPQQFMSLPSLMPFGLPSIQEDRARSNDTLESVYQQLNNAQRQLQVLQRQMQLVAQKHSNAAMVAKACHAQARLLRKEREDAEQAVCMSMQQQQQGEQQGGEGSNLDALCQRAAEAAANEREAADSAQRAEAQMQALAQSHFELQQQVQEAHSNVQALQAQLPMMSALSMGSLNNLPTAMRSSPHLDPPIVTLSRLADSMPEFDVLGAGGSSGAGHARGRSMPGALVNLNRMRLGSDSSTVQQTIPTGLAADSAHLYHSSLNSRSSILTHVDTNPSGNVVGLQQHHHQHQHQQLSQQQQQHQQSQQFVPESLARVLPIPSPFELHLQHLSQHNLGGG